MNLGGLEEKKTKSPAVNPQPPHLKCISQPKSVLPAVEDPFWEKAKALCDGKVIKWRKWLLLTLAMNHNFPRE